MNQQRHYKFPFRRKSTWLAIILMGLMLALGLASSQPATKADLAALAPEAIFNDIQALASARFAGRQAGTSGDWQAGLYVAERFRRLGLKGPFTDLWPDMPAPPKEVPRELRPYFQPFPLVLYRIDAPLSLTLKRGEEELVAQPGEDFLPFLDGASATLAAPVVFVGYGLNTRTGINARTGIKDEARRYNDYQGMEVSGKVLLMFKGAPKGWRQAPGLVEKVKEAKARGGLAVLLVTGPRLDRYEQMWGLGQRPTLSYSYLEEKDRLPLLHVSPRVAQWLMAEKSQNLTSLQQRIDQSGQPQSFSLGTQVSLKLNIFVQPNAWSANVAGLLAGRSPGEKEEYIVVGAHRDAFGFHAGQLLFPGADDNASGTAMLLALAQALAQRGPPKRSILFLSFSGEENGLLGASHFVSQSPVPIQGIKAMLNIDGVGVGSGRIILGLSNIDRPSIEKLVAQTGLKREVAIRGFFPGGDHVPFAKKKVPTMVLATSGPRPDMHQTTDTPDKIDRHLVSDVTRLGLALLEHLAY